MHDKFRQVNATGKKLEHHSYTTGYTPCTPYTSLEKAKHSGITCNRTVLELNVTSLACWLSCYSFLIYKLSELLSWIRNLRKNRIHSIAQFFCSRFSMKKKSEIMSIDGCFHRRNTWIDISTILPSTPLIYSYFSSEGLFCFYVSRATVCCLKYPIRSVLVWNHQSQTDWC